MLVQSSDLFENMELLIIYHDESTQPTPQFHKHDYYEITLMLSGEIDCHFEDCTCRLSAGDILLIRPDDIHWKEMIHDGSHFIVSVLAPVIEEALDYLMGTGADTEMFRTGHLAPCMLSTPDFKHIRKAVTQLSDDYVTSSENMKLRLRALVVDILTVYLAHNHTVKDASGMPAWLDRYLEEFQIKSNLIQGVSYFENIPVSRGHLCRLFKKHLHMTVIQYVNDAKLSYAARALLQSDVPIIEISEDIGFSSLSHFYRLFRSKYGVTPNEYRILGADRRAKLFRTYRDIPDV